MDSSSPPEWRCNLIGNGPSKQFWIQDFAEHVHEMSIGANLEQRCRLTSIYDRKIISEVCGKKRRINRPVILVGNAAEHALQEADFYRRAVVVGIVRQRPLKPQNAGQGALIWAMRCGYDPIHIYGWDSLYTGERKTDSDQFWPRPPTLCQEPNGWRKGWMNIFDVFKSAHFYLHVPEGVQRKDLFRKGWDPERGREYRKRFTLVHHAPESSHDDDTGAKSGED